MTKEEIFATVKEIAAEELDIDEAKIVLDAKIKEDLEADSLDVFEINWKTSLTLNWMLKMVPKRLTMSLNW